MAQQGVVEVIDDSKTGVGKRGPWTLFKVKVSGKWMSYGFKRPDFRVGDSIEFDVQNDGKGDNIKNARVVSGGGSGSGGGSTPPPPPSQPSGPPQQEQIVWQHSQEMAERRMAILLAANALPLSKADNKAGEAKRFEEIQEIGRKLTVQFYNDVRTGRLAKFVADTVPAVKADAPVPTPKSKEADDDLGDGDDA